jgi:hypothetical protein
MGLVGAYPHYRLYGGMFPIIYLAVLMQSHVFSGGRRRMSDPLLLKAKPVARGKHCALYDGDMGMKKAVEELLGVIGLLITWRYEHFFEDGMWLIRPGDISVDNYKQMSEGA